MYHNQTMVPKMFKCFPILSDIDLRLYSAATSGEAMKSSFKTKRAVLFYAVVSVLTFIFFQNCSKTSFAQAPLASLAPNQAQSDASCRKELQPLPIDYVACLSPNQTSLLAVQNYSVICQKDTSWARTATGPVNYSACPNVCPGLRPPETENVPCPAPYSNEIKGVQLYAVQCSADRQWSRTVVTGPNYSLCSKTCNPGTKPPESTPVACPAGQTGSATQYYSASTCSSSTGLWSVVSPTNLDVRNCVATQTMPVVCLENQTLENGVCKANCLVENVQPNGYVDKYWLKHNETITTYKYGTISHYKTAAVFQTGEPATPETYKSCTDQKGSLTCNNGVVGGNLDKTFPQCADYCRNVVLFTQKTGTYDQYAYYSATEKKPLPGYTTPGDSMGGGFYKFYGSSRSANSTASTYLTSYNGAVGAQGTWIRSSAEGTLLVNTLSQGPTLFPAQYYGCPFYPDP